MWIYRPHVINKRVSCAVVSSLAAAGGEEQIIKLEREIVAKSSNHDNGKDTVLIGIKACLFIYLFIYLFICLFVCLFV